MANTHCPDCGASYAMVGRVHRCISIPRERAYFIGGTPVDRPADVSESYKYRDPEKRRAYMREYMRRVRNRDGKEAQEAGTAGKAGAQVLAPSRFS